MVKVYLSRKGIPFTEKNVSTDADARTVLLDMGHRSTPVTTIGAQRWWVTARPNWKRRWQRKASPSLSRT